MRKYSFVFKVKDYDARKTCSYKYVVCSEKQEQVWDMIFQPNETQRERSLAGYLKWKEECAKHEFGLKHKIIGLFVEKFEKRDQKIGDYALIKSKTCANSKNSNNKFEPCRDSGPSSDVGSQFKSDKSCIKHCFIFTKGKKIRASNFMREHYCAYVNERDMRIEHEMDWKEGSTEQITKSGRRIEYEINTVRSFVNIGTNGAPHNFSMQPPGNAKSQTPSDSFNKVSRSAPENPSQKTSGGGPAHDDYERYMKYKTKYADLKLRKRI